MRYLIFDVETTDLSKDATVCQLGWGEVSPETLELVDYGEMLVNPGQPISPAASGVHNITDADVADAPTLDEIEFPTDPVCFIAHNAAFDLRFLHPYLNVQMTLDTLRAARKIFPDAPDHKLSTLKYFLSLDRVQSHAAGNDVLLCYGVLRAAMDRMDCSDLRTFVETVAEPTLVTVMPFGKYKGARLIDLPPSYVRWLLTLENLDEDLRYSLQQL